MTAYPADAVQQRAVDMFTAQKSNKKEVSHYLTGETFVRKAEEGVEWPPPLTLRALILISLPRLDWQEFHR